MCDRLDRSHDSVRVSLTALVTPARDNVSYSFLVVNIFNSWHKDM